MQPESPNNLNPEDSQPQGTPAEQPLAPAQGQVFSPNEPPASPTFSPATPTPPGNSVTPNQPAPQVPQDNHRILNDFGSPAFPTPAPMVTPEPKKSYKKLIIILVIALIVLIAGSAAAYVGYVVPNKPENLWKSAVVNTGKGYDQLVKYAEDTDKVQDWSQEGSFALSGDVSADGSFQGKSSKDTSQYTGSVSAAGLKIGFDVRTFPSATATPDVYIKADGLQDIGSLFGMGNPQLTSALNGINNQWYVIDHTLFDQLGAPTDEMDVTSDDVTAFVKTAGETTKKYLFTDDPEQSIITRKQDMGKESRDGRSVYHYKVALDKTNTKAYLNALCADYKNSNLGKSLKQESYDCKNFTKNADDIKETDTADAWVDTKTRLFQAVRITDTKVKTNYIEVSQNFDGGDTMPIKFIYDYTEDNETLKATVDATLNHKTKETKLNASFAAKESSSNVKGTFKFTAQPSKDPVKVEKPANAKTIIQLANDLGFGELLNSGLSGVSGSAGQPGNQIEDTTPANNIMLLFENSHPSSRRAS